MVGEIDWSGYNTFGKGVGDLLGSAADRFGLSGKAQAQAKLQATLLGQPEPQGPLQQLFGQIKTGLGFGGGKGLDARGVAQQALTNTTGQGPLSSLSAPQTTPVGPGASLSPQDMATLTQRYGGGTAPIGAVTQGRDLTPADNFSQRYSAGDPNALKPMGLTPQTAQTARADISPAAAYITGGNGKAYPVAGKPGKLLNPELPADDPANQVYQRGATYMDPSQMAPGAAVPANVAALDYRTRPTDRAVTYDPQAAQREVQGAQGAAPAGGLDINRAARAIQQQESGGNYQAVGPVTTYKDGRQDRPYGAYQVMGANVGPWTQQYYGQALTPAQFMANPQAQDAVFQGEFGRLSGKFGPEGAAQAWLGGPGSVGQTNRADVNGTTVGQYGQQFARNYGAGGGGVQIAQAAPMGTATDATGTIPAVTPAAQTGFGANIPTEALVKLLTNQYLPAEDKGIVMSLLQTRMPQQKQYGFQLGADGTLYRTNATTGEAAVAAQGGMKPTSDIQEYNLYKQQGGTDDFTKWTRDNKAAGRTTVNVDNAGESSFAKGLYGDLGKNYAALANDGQSAKTDLSNIQTLRESLAQTPGGWKGGVMSLAQDWGIDIGKGNDAVQVAKSVLARLTPAQRVPGSGTTSDRDLEMFKGALPKLMGSNGGNELVADTMQAMAEFKLAQSDIANRLIAGDFNTEVDPTGIKGATAAMRALPDPMTAFKAKGRDVIAGKPYQSANAPGAIAQPQTKQDFEALPKGTMYIDPDDGKTYRK